MHIPIAWGRDVGGGYGEIVLRQDEREWAKGRIYVEVHGSPKGQHPSIDPADLRAALDAVDPPRNPR